MYSTELETRLIDQCRLFILRYDEYLDNLDTLWMISKPGIRAGELHRHTAEHSPAPYRIPVGDHLLTQMIWWREELFGNFWRHNRERGSSLAQTDEAIQRLINRLIFIRTCEDRGIEENRLMLLLQQRDTDVVDDIWTGLLDLFRELNQVYDSQIFERHLLDILDSDEQPLRSMIEDLYYVSGPVRYQFDVLPPQILAQSLEQYLDFVGQTSLFSFEPSLDQTVELASRKHSYRGAGIHYTPVSVIECIVDQTLGSLLNQQSLYDARDLTILDLACGSGSFLLAAYERLLHHHSRTLQQPNLSQPERLDVLKQNIYGIDLDPQAVESARLNLLLHALEIPRQLPTLASNLRQGNCLVEGRAAELEPIFGEHWQILAQPFNWQQVLPQVEANGGFDVIIGNPPHTSIQTLPEPDQVYLEQRYRSAGNRDCAIYSIFVERGWSLLRPGGVLGLVLPNEFLTTPHEHELRRFLLKEQAVWQIVNFGPAQIIADSTIKACMLFLRKGDNPEVVFIDASNAFADGRPGILRLENLPQTRVPYADLESETWPTPRSD